MKKIIFLTVISAFIAVSSAFSAAPTATFTPVPGGWNTLASRIAVGGAVCAVTVTSTDVFIGGKFSWVGESMGHGIPVNPASGSVITGFPAVTDGTIYAVEPDGAGGWYIGGEFHTVAGLTRNHIARIYGNGSLDPDFNPNANSNVNVIKLTPAGLFIGGAFSSVGGTGRNRAAKIDPATGALDTGFNALISSGTAVFSFAYTGTSLYIGGNIVTVSGMQRYGIVKVDPASGALDPAFNAVINAANYTVYSILPTGSSLTIGGRFNLVGGLTRNNLARIYPDTGNVDIYDPNVNSTVFAMATDGAAIFIGGDFTAVGGQPCSRTAKVDSTGARVTAFSPNPNNTVRTLVLVGTRLFVGGAFTNLSGSGIDYAACVDTAAAAVDTAFAPKPDAFVRALGYDAASVYMGGDFITAGPRYTGKNIAKLNLSTGLPDTLFYAEAGDTVNAITYDGSGNIYIGGTFTKVGSQTRTYAAKLNAGTGDLNPAFTPAISGGLYTVYTMMYDAASDSVYIGGNFSTVTGTLRNNAAKVSAITGVTDPLFMPEPASTVYTFLDDGTEIFIGGSFSALNGITRYGLAKVDRVTGELDYSFNAAFSGATIRALAYDGTNLYAGGSFQMIAGVYRYDLAKVNAGTGALDPYFSVKVGYGSCCDYIYSMALKPGALFISGDFTTMNDLPYKYIAKVYTDNGAFDTSFSPQPDKKVYALGLDPAGGVLYAGGEFGLFLNNAAPGFAGAGIIGAPTPSITPTWTISRTATETRTLTITRTHSVTSTHTIALVTFTETPTFTATRTSTRTPSDTPVFSATMSHTITSIPAYPTATGTVPSLNYSLLEGPAVDGTVYAVTVTADNIYIGGSFSQVGPRIGCGVPVDGNTGIAQPGYPQITGQYNYYADIIYTAEPDGGGGWYIGGSIAYAAGLPRNRLIHVFANGSLDTIFNPNVNSEVYCLYFDGTYLYVGGDFGNIGGLSRPYLAKIHGATGAGVSSFNANVSGYVFTMIPDGAGNLFIGGSIYSVGGQVRGRGAKVSMGSGAVDPLFDPGADVEIAAMDHDGSSVYIGGYFTNISGTARAYAAKVNAVTGALDSSFIPSLNEAVRSVRYKSGSVYLGGYFTSPGGNAFASYAAKFSAVTGALDMNFRPNITGDTVLSMDFDQSGSYIYTAGLFTRAGGRSRINAAKLNAATGAADAGFAPNPNDKVQTAVHDGTSLFLGGNFTSVNGVMRSNLAKINKTTLAVDTSFPEANGTVVHTLALGSSGSIYAGGDFLLLGGKTRYRIGRITAAGMVDDNFIPFVDDEVKAIACSGNSVYAGGEFLNVLGYDRQVLVKFNAADGTIDTSFNPAVEHSNFYPLFNCMVIHNNDMYVYGSFDRIGGIENTDFVKLNALTGEADPVFSPGVYLDGGGMDYGAGSLFVDTFKMNAVTGAIDTVYDPDIWTGVNSVLYDPAGGVVYLGPYRVYPSTGAHDTLFAPLLDPDNVQAAAIYGDTVYLGGGFKFSNHMVAPGLIAIRMSAPPSPTNTRTVTSTRVYSPSRTATQTLSSTLTHTVSPTITVSPTRTKPGTDTPTKTATEIFSPTITNTLTPVLPFPTLTFTPFGPGTLMNLAVTDGSVYCITSTAGEIYIGGSFNTVSRRTGSGIPFSTSTNNPLPDYPEVAGGSVYCALPDGSGGWYIGGSFTHVAGLPRTCVAHIFGNNAVDPDFSANIVNFSPPVEVRCLAFDGAGNIFVAGNFERVNGINFVNVAKLNAATGVPDASFVPGNPSGDVISMAYNGHDTLYLGMFWYDIAKINAYTGAMDTSFDPGSVNGKVNALVLADGWLYCGGEFSTLGNKNRQRFGRIDPATGNADDSFIMDVNGPVLGLNSGGGGVMYISGRFDMVAGVNKFLLAKINTQSQAVYPSFGVDIGNGEYISEEVNCAAPDPSGNVYLSGYFFSIAGQPVSSAAKVDAITGDFDPSFNPKFNTYARVAAVAPGAVYYGGDFDGVDPVRQPKLAKLSAITGNIDTAFKPMFGYWNGPVVRSLLLYGGSLYAGGIFSQVNGFPREGLAKLNSATGTTDPGFDARLDLYYYSDYSEVYALATDGTSLYAGGKLDIANGQPRGNCAKLDFTTGAVDPYFNPGFSGYVYDLAFGNGSIYAGGSFSTVNNKSAVGAAKIDTYFGLLDPVFSVNAYSVYSLDLDGNNMYIGGSFTTVNGQPKISLAKISSITGSVDAAFSQQSDTYVYQVLYDGANLYTAGNYINAGGQPRKSIARLFGATGIADPSFNPGADKWVRALEFSPSKDILYVGGDFLTLAGMPAAHFGAIKCGPPPSPSATPSITRTRTVSPTRTVTPVLTHTSTATPMGTFTDTPTTTESPTISETHTISPTFTESRTHTVSPTISETHTETPVHSATQSPSGTPVYTLTRTTTVTPTRTATFRPTATVTQTPYLQAELVLVFPNPNKGQMIVSLNDNRDATDIEIKMYTSGFRLIRSFLHKPAVDRRYYIDASAAGGEPANGTYLLSVVLFKDGVRLSGRAIPVIIIKP